MTTINEQKQIPKKPVDWVQRCDLAYPQYEAANEFYTKNGSRIETMRKFDLTPHQFKHMLQLRDGGEYL